MSIIDVYKFAYSAKCPIALSEAIISVIDKIFYSLDLEVQKEIQELNNEYSSLLQQTNRNT